MKMKQPQQRTSWTAVLAALGATAAMLPVQAQNTAAGAAQADSPGAGTSQWEQNRPPGAQGRGMAGPSEGPQQMDQGRDAAGSPGMQGGMYSDKPLTSTHQPEMSTAPGGPQGPGALSPDAQQSRDAQGMGMQGDQQQQGQDAQGGGMQGGAAGGTGTQQGGQQQQGGMYSDKPMTSTHQPEMSTAPGGPQGPGALPPDAQQSRDAQGMGMPGGAAGGMGMQQGSQGGAGAMGGQQQAPTSTHQPEIRGVPGQQGGTGMQGSGMMGAQPQAQQGTPTDLRPLTREEVQAETAAWREAGLLELMDSEDSSVWMDPEVRRERDQLNSEVRTQRGLDEPPGMGTRDASGMGPGGSR